MREREREEIVNTERRIRSLYGRTTTNLLILKFFTCDIAPNSGGIVPFNFLEPDDDW